MTDNLNTLPTGDVGALVERLRGHKCPECKGWGEVSYFGELVACKCNGHYEAPITMEVREQAAATILALTAEVERARAVAKANNDLARREANHRRELQAENARLRDALRKGLDQAENGPPGYRIKFLSEAVLSALEQGAET